MCIHDIRRGVPAILALALFLGGCGQNTAKIDLSELRDPLIRKAKAKADGGDRKGALECLNQALEKRPGMAQAHLDAGLIYDDYKKDYVRAVYHYQRYLELRPDTEKKDMIEEIIHKARISFAASVSDPLPGFPEKFKALQEENARLKSDLRDVRANLAERATTPSVPGMAAETGVTPAPSSKPVVALDETSRASAVGTVSPTGQVYRVQEHETLSMIAAKVYQSPGKWKVIFEANRQTLGSPEKLRPGQILIIPR